VVVVLCDCMVILSQCVESTRVGIMAITCYFTFNFNKDMPDGRYAIQEVTCS